MATLLAVAGSATACTSTVTGHGRRAACGPVFFGVPGSGQGRQNLPPNVLPEGVSLADATDYGTTVGLLKTKLAELAGNALESASAIDYPAIAVNKYVGADGLTSDLEVSEAAGVQALVADITASYADGCTDRPVLLSGYSQGAEVVIRSVLTLTPSQQSHVSVALFGNPSYVPGVSGDYPGTSGASGIRPSFRHVAYQLPPDVRFRTIDVCAPGDAVCGVDPDRTTIVGKVAYVLSHTKAHTDAYAFEPNGYVEHAAEFLWNSRT